MTRTITMFASLALLCFATHAFAQSELLSGAGDATFYYDINGGGTCGPANGISSYPETEGFSMCEWNNPTPRTLGSYNTNNIVALPNQILNGNLSKYCGKKVVVTIDGKERDDLNLYIWDGCEACNANNGLDFSSTIFGDLFGEGRCGEGRIEGELSWKIVDEQVEPYNFGG